MQILALLMLCNSWFLGIWIRKSWECVSSGSHFKLLKPVNKQTAFISYGTKTEVSLVECGVKGNPVLDMLHYLRHTYINRQIHSTHNEPSTH